MRWAKKQTLASIIRWSHFAAREGCEARAKPEMTAVKATVSATRPVSSMVFNSASALAGCLACASAAITVLKETESGAGRPVSPRSIAERSLVAFEKSLSVRCALSWMLHAITSIRLLVRMRASHARTWGEGKGREGI